MIPSMPSFPKFYREIHGREPFPWQRRLAAQVAKHGFWPSEIGVPTGLGKTVCLEIAVWWLASQADRAPAKRTAPTRIWWVVNRRLLVDSTASHARKLSDLLLKSVSTSPAGSKNPAILAVAKRLAIISTDACAPPLEVISLRGGMSSGTPIDPSRPTVILCTLPMYGSRLLFRGYGSTHRAVDAAMAGVDSLVLLDEAHLAPHLNSLLEALRDCVPGVRPLLNGSRSQAVLVALTATGRPDETQRFDLDEEDSGNAEVRRRLDTPKPLEIRIKEPGDVSGYLQEAAIDLLQNADAPRGILVFTNTPKTARDVYKRLVKFRDVCGIEMEVLLLTGLMREREASIVREKILHSIDGMPAERKVSDRKRHLVVVATQTLEVGADLDAEYLVTEACGVRALTQRLGRLNRLGRHSRSKAIYVHAPPEKSRRSRSGEFWPVYGDEPLAVLERMQSARKDRDGMVDLCPRLIAKTLGSPGDDLGRAPEVLPGILWEWTKTTTPPEGEAPVEPYFSGIASPTKTVSVFWRLHIPSAGERIWPRATDIEAVDIQLSVFRDTIAEESVSRLASDGVTLEESTASDLKPGDRIILPITRGLLDDFGWNPDASEPVVDVSLKGHGLPLDGEAIKMLCGLDVSELIRNVIGSNDEEFEDFDESEQRKSIAKIVEAVQNAPAPAGWDEQEWNGFTNSLEPNLVVANKEVPRLPVGSPRDEARNVEFDETSLAELEALGDLATLYGHGNAVGSRASSVARGIGLPTRLVESIKLAGDLHDIGKADGRFQRWLDPNQKYNVKMAKSGTPRHQWASTRAAAGWPRGGRHEALSARLAAEWLKENSDWGTSDERDLLLHLIISHHGKGRPVVLPAADGSLENVRAMVGGRELEVSADLAQVDWTQPERFRRLNERFGPWGLALLEAVIIRSDHAVSAVTSMPNLEKS